MKTFIIEKSKRRHKPLTERYGESVIVRSFEEAFIRFKFDERYKHIIINDSFFFRRAAQEFYQHLGDYDYKDVVISVVLNRNTSKVFSYLQFHGFHCTTVIPFYKLMIPEQFV